MRASVKAANLPVSSDAGFYPMDACDHRETTSGTEFGYQIAFMDTTDTCHRSTAVGKAGSGLWSYRVRCKVPKKPLNRSEEGIAGFVRALKLDPADGCPASSLFQPKPSTPDHWMNYSLDWDTPNQRAGLPLQPFVAQWWREHSCVHGWVPGQLQSQLQVAVLGDSPSAWSMQFG